MKAPYEERDVPSKDFDVEVNYTIRKTCRLRTDNYGIECDDFERQAFVNTELTDWKQEFECTHYTINELLRELGKYIKKDIESDPTNKAKCLSLQRMYDDVQGWDVVESEFVEL